MTTTQPIRRSHRLEKLIARLTRAYNRRKLAGRDCRHLFIRSRNLSDAYLAAREEELNA